MIGSTPSPLSAPQAAYSVINAERVAAEQNLAEMVQRLAQEQVMAKAEKGRWASSIVCVTGKEQQLKWPDSGAAGHDHG